MEEIFGLLSAMFGAESEGLFDVTGTTCIFASGILIHDNDLKPDHVVGLRTLLYFECSIADPFEEL